MSIHIFTTPHQSATSFLVEGYTFGERRRRIKCNPRALRWCWNCDKRHWAKNLTVQVYYDGVRFFCRDKKKCKQARKRKR